MPLVVAIEPDQRQAGLLRRLVREYVSADLLWAATKDRALAAISSRVPDLILVSALLPPRDESELTEHLRGLQGATHLQTLTIPQLAPPGRRPRRGRTLLGALGKRRGPDAGDGCDLETFAAEIRTYLERACELRAETEALAGFEKAAPALPETVSRPALEPPAVEGPAGDEPVPAQPAVEQPIAIEPAAEPDIVPDAAGIELAIQVAVVTPAIDVPHKEPVEQPLLDQQPDAEPALVTLTVEEPQIGLLTAVGPAMELAPPELPLVIEAAAEPLAFGAAAERPAEPVEPQPDQQPAAELAVTEQSALAVAIDAAREESGAQLPSDQQPPDHPAIDDYGIEIVAQAPPPCTEAPEPANRTVLSVEELLALERELEPDVPVEPAFDIVSHFVSRQGGAREATDGNDEAAIEVVETDACEDDRADAEKPDAAEDDWLARTVWTLTLDMQLSQIRSNWLLDPAMPETPPSPDPIDTDTLAATLGLPTRRRPGGRLRTSHVAPPPFRRLSAARLTPLAIWARSESDLRKRETTSTVERDIFGSLIETLKIPSAVARVGYASGCHIGHVRVAPSSTEEVGDTPPPVIILSRRSLKRPKRSERRGAPPGTGRVPRDFEPQTSLA